MGAFEGGLEERVRIFVKNGLYNEPPRFGTHSTEYKYSISLIGESRDGVVIQYGNYKGLQDDSHPDFKPGSSGYWYGNNQAATMTINTEDFYGENFTVVNTKDTNVYAPALYIAGRRQAYKNVSVKGHRGTVIIRNGRPAFFMDSYVEGTQEITASNGTVLFYHSTLYNKGENSPYAYPEDNIYNHVAAPGDTLRYGHIFRDCTFEAPESTPDGSLFLAQPTAKESGAMFINCKLTPKINPQAIKPHASNVLANQTSWFYEYKNTRLDGTTPFDFTGRADNLRTLTDAYLNDYVYNNYIYGKFYDASKGGPTYYWDPLMLAAPCDIPQVTKNGAELSWNPVPGAVGYVIYKDGAYDGMTVETSYVATGDGTYTVCSVSESGAMSKPSGSDGQLSYSDLAALLNNNISNGLQQTPSPAMTWAVNNGIVTFAQPCDVEVYNLAGRLVLNARATSEVSLQAMPRGMYLLKTSEGYVKVIR